MLWWKARKGYEYPAVSYVTAAAPLELLRF
jgi:hypothetical protein